jgi:hypothetical protein
VEPARAYAAWMAIEVEADSVRHGQRKKERLLKFVASGPSA